MQGRAALPPKPWDSPHGRVANRTKEGIACLFIPCSYFDVGSGRTSIKEVGRFGVSSLWRNGGPGMDDGGTGGKGDCLHGKHPFLSFQRNDKCDDNVK